MRVLVTGASTGLGLATARALLGEGHDVVVHVRKPSRIAGTDDIGLSWYGVACGDLAHLDQIRDVAMQAQSFGRFDAVVHNAGTMDPPATFAVNAVAPYLLSALIDQPARLIFLSSSMHLSGSPDLRRVERAEVTYSDSKLYVTALALALAARWKGCAVHAVDPGWVPTRMGGAGAPDGLDAGHQTQMWLVRAGGDIRPETGGYWHHRELRPTHRAAADLSFQQALLEVLAAHCGVALP